jgi:hypothetical protein
MNTKTFVEAMQRYYGMAYQPGTGEVVTRYLDATFRENELEHLAAMTIKTYSGRYKTLPDVAVFEELRPAVMDATKYQPASSCLRLEGLADPDARENLAHALEDWMGKMKLKGEIKA